MDPVSVGLLAALAGGAGGELGRDAWAALSALVRRPFRRGGADEDGPAAGSGEAELARLAQNPADQSIAQALSTTLAVRAALDAEFRAVLAAWQDQVQRIPLDDRAVHNTISGGTQHGPALQGRDFSNLTFTMAAPRSDRPGGSDRGGQGGTAG
ncbi:hypothetical protein [Kitasatospora azatica]|uniref:hypothetical protein n=1 Tax=Kitasatospora azatica TaxID=58347 RepID=UPI00068AC9C7|nr:hypothetical protein [Kitasatospora azatica]